MPSCPSIWASSLVLIPNYVKWVKMYRSSDGNETWTTWTIQVAEAEAEAETNAIKQNTHISHIVKALFKKEKETTFLIG